MRKGKCKLVIDNCKLINEDGEQGRLLTTRRHITSVFDFHLEICNSQLSIRNLSPATKGPLTLALSPQSRGEGTRRGTTR